MNAPPLPDPRQQGLRNDQPVEEGLMLRLPPVRGSLTPNAPLAATTWFRVGGPAEVLFKPADADDLAWFLAHCPQDVPVTVLGVASNVLIRDGGIPGVVVRLGPTFAGVRITGGMVTAGAAALDLNVARSAQVAGLAGLEFLCGIPGTIGGGLRMNAGSYGVEFKDIVTEVQAVDRAGNIVTYRNEQVGFRYRGCAVPSDTIFTAATLAGDAGDPAAIKRRMDEIQASRAASQPIRDRTAGSTFANPDNDPKGRKAWQLIDEAGCRGLKKGRAKVSDKHCNFLINTGYATAEEIEALGEEVRRRVQSKTGIELRWEVRRLGVAKPSASPDEGAA